MCLLFLIAGCATGGKQRGYAVASWYGQDFHGKLTASGEKYDMHGYTCAHKRFPFGTNLEVTNIDNGKSVKVVVNDRGPFVRGRDIDLSYAAAKEIGIVGPGTGKVRLRVVGREEKYVKYIKPDGMEHGNGPFTVQVGSFEDGVNAMRLQTGLKLMHGKTYLRKVSVKGKKYYRVRVGKFDAYDKAFDYAKTLADEGYSAMVMQYE